MVKDWYKELLGAIARGWCTPKNEKKVMDTELAEAIAKEVSPLIENLLTQERNEIEEIIERTKMYEPSDPTEWSSDQDYYSVPEVNRTLDKILSLIRNRNKGV